MSDLSKSFLIDVVSNGIVLETSGPMCSIAVAQSISGLTSDYFYNPDAQFVVRLTDEAKKDRLRWRLENNEKAKSTPAKIAVIRQQMDAETKSVNLRYQRGGITQKERDTMLARIQAYGKLEMDSLPKMLA